ncbi:hypothetical protein B0H13DRAFT_2330109 [Mycena leptocephala]|nr:hypothetical protein B0H13DRAFT_2330109 [Mycena leptocephala]
MSSPRAVLRGRHGQYATADSVDPARAQARSAALRPRARDGMKKGHHPHPTRESLRHPLRTPQARDRSRSPPRLASRRRNGRRERLHVSVRCARPPALPPAAPPARTTPTVAPTHILHRAAAHTGTTTPPLHPDYQSASVPPVWTPPLPLHRRRLVLKRPASGPPRALCISSNPPLASGLPARTPHALARAPRLPRLGSGKGEGGRERECISVSAGCFATPPPTAAAPVCVRHFPSCCGRSPSSHPSHPST